MKSRLLCAVSACLIAVVSQIAHAVILPLEGRLETTPGSGVYEAYYDPNLDITWAAEADMHSFNTWDNQATWAASLTIGDVSGWRLPSADVNGDGTVVDCSGGGVAGCADNEMGFLYWEEGITADAPSPFNGVQADVYWSSTESTSPSFSAWLFDFDFGDQNPHRKDNYAYAWAVRSGDVSAVPIPAAVWLFGSGLLGLIGIARRK